LLWLSVWSEVQIVWCHCQPQTPSSLTSFKSRLVLPFWCQLTQVVLGKRLLNVLVVVVVCIMITYWTFDGITWWFDVHYGCQLTFVFLLSSCRHNSRCLLCFYFLGTQNFDVIRFATYRTACKLRFVQKRTNCKFCWSLFAPAYFGLIELSDESYWYVAETLFAVHLKKACLYVERVCDYEWCCLRK